MSQKNREGKRTARERLQEQREREKAADKRRKALKVAGVVATVLGVTALAGAVAANHQGGGGDGAAGAAEPIVDGRPSAPVTLTVYEDFRCPGCGQFENGFRDTIHRLQNAGKLKVEYHLVTIIDGNMGGNGSTYAANAAACAHDEGAFREYHDVLFENQPEEPDDAFGDRERLIELAGEVRGLSGPDFTRCVKKGTHEDWVERSNSAFLESDFNATPTVLLEGENIYGDPADPLTPDKLEEKVEEAAQRTA